MAKSDPIFDPDAPAQPNPPAPVEQPGEPPVEPQIQVRSEHSAPEYQVVRVATGEQRSVGVAYALFCLSFVGVAGIQHFYLGHFFRGTLWLLTWGLFGIGLIYDLFATGSQVYAFNVRRSTLIAQPLS